MVPTVSHVNFFSIDTTPLIRRNHDGSPVRHTHRHDPPCQKKPWWIIYCVTSSLAYIHPHIMCPMLIFLAQTQPPLLEGTMMDHLVGIGIDMTPLIRRNNGGSYTVSTQVTCTQNKVGTSPFILSLERFVKYFCFVTTYIFGLRLHFRQEFSIFTPDFRQKSVFRPLK